MGALADRFELLCEKRCSKLAQVVREDIATVSPETQVSGCITVELVEQEIQRLQSVWAGSEPVAEYDALLAEVLSAEQLEQLDPFDRPQLASAIAACRGSRSLSEGGRRLFAVSRAHRKSTNDADRLRRYLARFDLTWKALSG